MKLGSWPAIEYELYSFHLGACALGGTVVPPPGEKLARGFLVILSSLAVNFKDCDRYSFTLFKSAE